MPKKKKKYNCEMIQHSNNKFSSSLKRTSQLKKLLQKSDSKNVIFVELLPELFIDVHQTENISEPQWR